mmetsp:Transcript_24726/g.52686  ORF Transcript_24726/g.52686 Transcript_24726/m.52686 type:complete len:95 (-) Transcript_24726:545-829(-)
MHESHLPLSFFCIALSMCYNTNKKDSKSTTIYGLCYVRRRRSSSISETNVLALPKNRIAASRSRLINAVFWLSFFCSKLFGVAVFQNRPRKNRK